MRPLSPAKSELFAFDKDEDGIPDGASVDTEGGVWIAVPGGAQVERRLPDGL
ncbi:SMP-30/gluconolactonase/LRE family protein [Ruegeria sp. HKCCA5426]|uniref:SMP-30/gluconolactonase/LRE family protein n=1 Tax=Ruegeria sp. HKCCA5426 TaxID=2682985 RepID=UPI001C2C535F|nr:SMP-30/gluconolactonase/LRE family protein [Ruegeria sp. HKCCA5426]